MDRREYQIDPIRINKILVSKVVVDSHYEEKHSEYINDDLILELVKSLDGRIEVPQTEDEEGYSYFSTLLVHLEKQYRLVWLLENDEIYVGVINAYRDNRKE